MMFFPSPPLLTCSVVFTVSIGIRNTRHDAAAADAATVLTALGRSFVSARESRIASTPAFAAVSPNLDKGPCRRPGPMPR